MGLYSDFMRQDLEQLRRLNQQDKDRRQLPVQLPIPERRRPLPEEEIEDENKPKRGVVVINPGEDDDK